MLSLEFFLLTFFFFVLGAAVGSFLNVVTLRTIAGESWIKGRSRCDHCQHQIAWFDNIPLLSFLILKGKCRYCQQAIDLIHPVVELLMASLFVWWFWAGSVFFKLTQQPFVVLQPVFWLVVGICFILIFVIDLQYLIIPDSLVVILVVATAAYRLILTLAGIMQPRDLLISLAAILVLSGFFFGLWFLTKGKGFGFGDVKLSIPLALLLGWPKVVVGVFLSFVLGSLVASILLVLKKKKFGQVIPFGPFLILGSTVALIWGARIWQWYLSLIFV
jgi:prepilin signal peptidase PulO-like enzyme (type II secretory pathway)